MSDDTNPKDRLGASKPQLWLVPSALSIIVSKVMELGAAKYGPYNWRTKKVRLTVYLTAAMRHILSSLDGEDIDPESGQPHTAHAAACMGIVLDALATGNLIDDRPTPGAAAKLIRDLTVVAERPHSEMSPGGDTTPPAHGPSTPGHPDYLGPYMKVCSLCLNEYPDNVVHVCVRFRHDPFAAIGRRSESPHLSLVRRS